MGRATVTGVLGFAVGVATGLIVALFVLGVAADGPQVILVTEPPRADARPESVVRRGAPPRARAAVADAADTRSPEGDTPAAITLVVPPREPGDPDVREFALAEAPTGFSEIEVQILDGSGEPAPGWDFLVVPAEAGFDRRFDDAESFARGETGEGGVARVRVPSPGRYTVQVDAGVYAIARHGVVVPTSGRVVLCDCPAADTGVTLVGDPGAENVVVTATAFDETIVLADGTSIFGFNDGGWNVTLNRAQTSAVMSMQQGLRFRLAVPPGWAAEPDVVRTPATVRVVRRPPCTLQVAATLRSAEGPAAIDRQIDVVFDAGAGPLDGLAFYAAAGESVDGDEADWEVPARSEKGVLRWSGPDVEPGAADFDLSGSDQLSIDVRHRSTPGLPAPRVVLEAPAGGEPADPRNALVWEPQRRGDEIRNVTLRPGREEVLPSPGSWLIVPSEAERDTGELGDTVAGPLRLAGGVRHAMRVVVGGYAIVVPRTPPPRGSGAIEIARADGAPLLVRALKNDSELTNRTCVDAGTVLGPFEPGEVVLDVFVGRVRWQRLAVLIRAGEKTALPVGPFGAAPR